MIPNANRQVKAVKAPETSLYSGGIGTCTSVSVTYQRRSFIGPEAGPGQTYQDEGYSVHQDDMDDSYHRE